MNRYMPWWGKVLTWLVGHVPAWAWRKLPERWRTRWASEVVAAYIRWKKAGYPE